MGISSVVTGLSRHRQLSSLLLALAVVALANSTTTPTYPPYIWGRPIGDVGRPMDAPPPTAPAWNGPTGLLEFDSDFRGGAHDERGLSSPEKLNDSGGTFFWALFRPDCNASFFFEAEFHGHGASWTAWLVHHGYSPPLQERFPVYIAKGKLEAERADSLLSDLQSTNIDRVPRYTNIAPGDGIAIAYLREGRNEQYIECLPISLDGVDQEVGLTLVRVVEQSLVADVETELRERLVRGNAPQGMWFFDNGVWPGERTSLHRELGEALGETEKAR